MKTKDLVGQRFGFLVVIERAGATKDRHARWKCLCDCGNEVEITGRFLNNNSSCGCRAKRIKNEIGNKYGKLTVIAEAGIEQYGSKMWLCKCDCGGEVIVKGANLRNGGTTSCGCTKSHGEEKIAQFLTEANIPYIKNYKVVIDNNNYFFDFYVDDMYFIEFDGEQHFGYRQTGWNNKENFLNNRKRDLIKNQYCFTKEIPIIRIPYNEYFDEFDLLIGSSRFVLNKQNEENYYKGKVIQ